MRILDDLGVSEIADWPGKTALHLRHAGALLVADAVIRDESGALAFVPDQLGEDPEHARRELSAGLTRLLDLEFDVLLLANGVPAPSGGKSGASSAEGCLVATACA